MMIITNDGWKPASVGCHWYQANYTISTYVAVENGKHVVTFPKSGYVLKCDREEIGKFKTLDAAKRAAAKHAEAQRVIFGKRGCMFGRMATND